MKSLGEFIHTVEKVGALGHRLEPFVIPFPQLPSGEAPTTQSNKTSVDLVMFGWNNSPVTEHSQGASSPLWVPVGPLTFWVPGQEWSPGK